MCSEVTHYFDSETYIGKTILISGFPAIGKSYLKQKMFGYIFDSDSSNFPKDDFPNNYISHIENLLKEYPTNKIILVSSHQNVREELKKRNIKYNLVYPKYNQKMVYIMRCFERGSNPEFVEMLINNWDKFLDSCVNDDFGKHYILDYDETLIDILDQILINN